MTIDVLANYSFLPWFKEGLSLSMLSVDNSDTDGLSSVMERGSLNVSIDLQKDGSGPVTNFGHTVQLLGPGDVLGINPKAIIRVEPPRGSNDLEPNYLPFIEFYDEDFPWRFTPALAKTTGGMDGNRLRPWIFLAILKDDGTEFSYSANPDGPLPYVDINDAGELFGDPLKIWAWAHVHVNDKLDEDGDPALRLEGIRADNPDNVIARLLGPRRLEPTTKYRAFVIPSFETGRVAGLGEKDSAVFAAIDATQPSWENGAAGSVRFPVYYEWFFSTDERGDFEYLVNKLVPRVLDEHVGSRKLDVRHPSDVINQTETGYTTNFIGMGGALRTPQTINYDWITGDDTLVANALTSEVNRAKTLMTSGGGTQDPVIAAPLYGRWHAMVDQLNGAEPPWVKDANTNPAHRATCGLGSEVIRRNQEKFMEFAWGKVEGIVEANQRIRELHLARLAAARLHARHALKFDNDRFIAVSGAVHDRTLIPTVDLMDQETVSLRVANSNLPRAAAQPTLRKAARPAAGVGRHLSEEAVVSGPGFQQSLISNLNNVSEVAITAAEPKADSIYYFDAENNLAPVSDYVSDIEATAVYNPSYTSDTGTYPDVHYNAFAELDTWFGDLTEAPAADGIDIADIAGKLTTKLNPDTAMTGRLGSLISINGLAPTIEAPILAAPQFPYAMYEHLRDMSQDYIIPNVDLVANESITLLETNPEFIDAYMLGLNHEMSRELLWREYPTDQRGTYFKQFWNVRDYGNPDYIAANELTNLLYDIKQIDLWPDSSALGSLDHRNAGSTSSQVVLLIRGSLLRKFPNAIIYAQAAAARPDPDPNPREPRAYADPVKYKTPIFKGRIAPDITFFGFDMSADTARDGEVGAPGGYYFVIQERPGEVRFGLDILGQAPGSGVEKWDDLAWEYLDNGTDFFDPETALDPPPAIPLWKDPDETIPNSPEMDVNWGANSADMAYIMYQLPARVAVHAAKMLPA